ncbi:CLUMA_CG009920, isoform A [Clunio marinus]|uniref:CLUMA_CG009920, isoform A n=1 Tax=Clunio marinus TaxID=568069 RepID=A0A1J1I827_9DIPT|nr:CLUMA_CG009920, isoform A [Clunio marinus]
MAHQIQNVLKSSLRLTSTRSLSSGICSNTGGIDNSNQSNKLHLAVQRDYPQAEQLPLPSNIDINETARFSPLRNRDITSESISIHNHGFNGIDVTLDHAQNKAGNEMNTPRFSNPHLESYDRSSAVNLSAVMQSTVPEPFGGNHKFSYLNMPGGSWGQQTKYLSHELNSAHYTELRQEMRNDWSNYKGINMNGLNRYLLKPNCLNEHHFLLINKRFISLSCNRFNEQIQKPTGESEEKTSEIKESAQSKLKKAVKEYGSTVIVFHVGISLISLGMFYVLVSSGLDVMALLEKINLADKLPKIAENASTFVIAYAIHKIFAPFLVLCGSKIQSKDTTFLTAMNNLMDSDIQRFVACLVLGYLENQQLQKAYGSFCDTSRHLVKERNGLKCGNKPLDTSIGLVNIVRDYFLFKSQINDFLRICPQSPIKIQLIETDSLLNRLKIILNKFRESLQKLYPSSNKKRKRNSIEDEFDISQTNTSTPESINPALKRRRKSITTPFLTLNNSKVDDNENVDVGSSQSLGMNGESNSSSSTSEKEDENEVESPKINKSSLTPDVLKKQISDSLLKRPDLADKIADLINSTMNAKETEPTTSKNCQENNGNVFTDEDLERILSETQNDPSFEEIINDIVFTYENQTNVQPPASVEPSTSSLVENSLLDDVEEVPLKRRLRPRSERSAVKTQSARKKKINIISNEPYNGIVPAVANLSPVSLSEEQSTELPQMLIQMPLFVQNGNEMIPVMQNIPSSVVESSSGIIELSLETFTTAQAVINNETEYTTATATMNIEKVVNIENQQESTPKFTNFTNFPSLHASKCNSTPRRKASHIRILNFNETPGNRRLSSIKEFQTPSDAGIVRTTPGSAPQFLHSLGKANNDDGNEKKEVLIDENSNSNSNSISNTPKVIKNLRGRKISVAKKEEKETKTSPSFLENLTYNDTKKMRNLPIDQQMRLLNQIKEDIVMKEMKRQSPKKKKTNRKKEVSNAKEKIKGKTKTPKKVAKVEKSPSTDSDENRPLSKMKFKIASPRKMTPKKSVKKKEKKIVEEPPVELNRSDTVQEVATILIDLSATTSSHLTENVVQVAAETNKKLEDENQNLQDLITPIKDSLETPFKIDALTPLPNTPRFAIPLTTSSLHETPITKVIVNSLSTITTTSLAKACDILTPSFPITPGSKFTPPKDVVDGSPSASSVYSTRRTDYSSCSSYYKPDETEEVDLNSFPSRRHSESDGNCCVNERRIKVVGSARKVECPGAMERVKSFTEDSKELPTPHYTMMDEGVLSESVMTTATDDSSNSSSSFTCSTCSTDDSSDDNIVEKLDKAEKNVEEKDSEWQCDDLEKQTASCSSSIVDERTGEVRFPLRNWMTPKKIDELPSNHQEIKKKAEEEKETNKIKLMLNEKSKVSVMSVEEQHKLRLKENEAVKQRTLQKIRKESAAINARSFPKMKKSNVKSFKLPAESVPRSVVGMSRKDHILQQNLTERPRPTPLKLISSSSRRKNATPRKTIVIDELPRQPSPIKKKKSTTKAEKPSPVKIESQLLLENATDNAMMPEDALGLNLSSSFNSSFEDESICTVVKKPSEESTTIIEEGSNTFQRSLIAQGFEKIEAKELQTELVDKLEKIPEPPALEVEAAASESDDDDDDESESEEELELCTAEANERNVFHHEESDNCHLHIPSLLPMKISTMILKFEEQTVTLSDSGEFDLFTMEPNPVVNLIKSKHKKSPTKKLNGNQNHQSKKTKSPTKESPSKSEKSKKSQTKKDQTKTSVEKPRVKINIKPKDDKSPAVHINSTDIRAILDKVHGK